MNLDLKYVLAQKQLTSTEGTILAHHSFVTATVHWFNPLSWFFLKKFLEETELACDEQVLGQVKMRKRHATALVDCAESEMFLCLPLAEPV